MMKFFLHIRKNEVYIHHNLTDPLCQVFSHWALQIFLASPRTHIPQPPLSLPSDVFAHKPLGSAKGGGDIRNQILYLSQFVQAHEVSFHLSQSALRSLSFDLNR